MKELADQLSIKQYHTVLCFLDGKGIKKKSNYFDEMQKPKALANARALGYIITANLKQFFTNTKVDNTNVHIFAHSIHAASAYFANEKYKLIYGFGFRKAISKLI